MPVRREAPTKDEFCDYVLAGQACRTSREQCQMRVEYWWNDLCRGLLDYDIV